MVSFASPFGHCVTTGLVGLNTALSIAEKQGITNIFIEPVWDGKDISVEYVKLKRQKNKHDKLLTKYGWPKDLRDNWKDWGGTLPKSLVVLAKIVVNKRGDLVPIAYDVNTSSKCKHNALLTRNLFVGHGIPTSLGWYKTVSVNNSIQTLKPMVNDLKLTSPGKWRLIGL